MRVWVMGVALVASSSCVIDVDYDGTQFQCAQSDTCPDGFECRAGRCVFPEDVADAGDLVGLRRHTVSVVGEVSGTIAGAPVLVALDPSRIDYAAAAPDGRDLRFVDAAGGPLAHEIERWDPAGRSAVWVKLPALETGSTFSMLYGDGAADSQRASEVWTAYDLVYHLDADGSDSRLGFDATARGGIAHAGGLAGGAATLDGVDDYYEIGQDLPLLRSATAGTASAWIRPATTGGSIFEIAINGGTTSRMFATMVAETGLFRLGVRTLDMTGPSANATSTVAPNLGEWVWVVGTADFAAQTVVVYVNGVESGRAEMLATDPTTPDTNAAIATIGIDDGLATGQFLGAIDEVRCAASALTAEWVAAQYLSMTDGLLSYGPAESP